MDEFSNNDQGSNGDAQGGPQPQVTDNNDLQTRMDSVRVRAQEALLALLPGAQGLSPEKRFDIYINDLHETNNPASAEAALEAALEIEDTNNRADALAEIVDEVDYYNLAKKSV